MTNELNTKKLTGIIDKDEQTRRNSPTAIIELGGKQHIVSNGAKVVVNRLKNEEGETITAKDMLGGADIQLKVVSHMLGKKINGLKFKSKVRYTRHYGHRQQLTTLEVLAGTAPKVAEAKISEPKTEKVAKKPAAKKVAAKK